MLNVNLLSGHAHCGTFPLVPCRLVKCLSGAIKFEYRIRPDWQDIMLMSTGFANGELVCDFPQRKSAFAYTGCWITAFYYGKLDWIVCLDICKRGRGIGHSRKNLCNHPLPTIHMNTMTEAESTMILSVTMSCRILMGVFALSLSGGRWPVFSAGVRLRQRGTGALSKNKVFTFTNMSCSLFLFFSLLMQYPIA